MVSTRSPEDKAPLLGTGNALGVMLPSSTAPSLATVEVLSDKPGAKGGSSHGLHHRTRDDSDESGSGSGGSSPRSPSGGSHRKLTLFKLVAITCVSAVYGLEDCVGMGGPYYTLLGMLVLGVLWCVPTALMTAEMSCMMPENGGQILWVDRTFGPFWSFQNSFMVLFVNVLNGATMPVLFLDYVEKLVGFEMSFHTRVTVGVGIMAVIALINIFGSDVVGKFSMLISTVATVPFVVLILVGLPHVDLEKSLERPAHFDMRGFFPLLLWNWAGMEGMGSYAGEVHNPARNVPAALMLSITIIFAEVVFSVIVGVSVLSASTWHDGSFMQVAHIIGGLKLADLFALGAAVGAAGELCALLMMASHIVYGMGKVGSLPGIFATVNESTGVPTYAMLLNVVVMGAFTALPFEALAEAEMLIYCVTLLFCFAACLKLRVLEPDRKRPYRIPLGK
eukprot:jgi/Mesvir1/27863/Mv07532-RA.1